MVRQVAQCVFCQIASGQLKAMVVLEADDFLAFRDINPQAPVHILIAPRQHYLHLGELNPDGANLLGRMLLAAETIAQEEHLQKWGYRVVLNSRIHDRYTVEHLHLHLLGGRVLGWPPG